MEKLILTSSAENCKQQDKVQKLNGLKLLLETHEAQFRFPVPKKKQIFDVSNPTNEVYNLHLNESRHQKILHSCLQKKMRKKF